MPCTLQMDFLEGKETSHCEGHLGLVLHSTDVRPTEPRELLSRHSQCHHTGLQGWSQTSPRPLASASRRVSS